MAETYLVQVLIILAAGIVCVPLFERFRLGPVLGYLFAGMIIGPGALGLVDSIEGVRGLGELGVVFLLFTIGLEFTRDRLKLLSARVYALGLLQIGLTAAVVAGLCIAAGLDGNQAAIIGGALALSSTAIVLPILGAMGKLNTVSGRTVVAVLLLQDLAVGPILVLIQTLSEGDGPLVEQLALATLKAAAAIIVILLVGRLVLRPAFRAIAETKSPEVFVGMVLLVALGTSFGTEHVGLSMAFGGFLAGLLLAETEFRHQVAADVQPFRGLLLGLFFMYVGMMVDLRLVVEHLGLVLGLAVALMLGKGLIILGLSRALGAPWGRAVRVAGMLAQGGEFGFISFGAAAFAGIISEDLARLLMAVVAVTMIAAPLVFGAGRAVYAWLEARGVYDAGDLTGERFDECDHVIIVGYGEVGQIVTRMVRAYGLRYVVLDLTPAQVKAARLEGEPVYFGDATRREVLDGVRAGDALVVVVATDNPGVAEGLAAMRRHAFPDLQILVRGGGEEAVANLRRVGLTPVGQEATDTGLKLTGAVLDLWHARESERADVRA